MAIKVMAIRKREDGTRWQNEFLRGIPTYQEAESVYKHMLGQDGIVDGYAIPEDQEPYPLDGTKEPETAPSPAHIPVTSVTRFVGNYAFAPTAGWFRFWTLANATWNA